MALVADASPTKKFFIANLTRDLTLEDAILDLIDNAVDGYVRTNKIDVSPKLLSTAEKPNGQDERPALVEISISADRFVISDRCGGIGLDRAKKYAFRFGNADPKYTGSFGVYGIGMKRALFKLGRQIKIESKTITDGFSMHIDVPEWEANDDDWELPMARVSAAQSVKKAGTLIEVRNLNPEVKLRLNDPTLLKRLTESVAVTYALFLSRFLSITINGKRVAPRTLPIGDSADLQPGFRELKEDGVTIELLAGLAARKGGEWHVERAGWYVLCNGRVVVAADKSELTGWGINGPQFVSKYRGFIGIAFFFSDDSARLPWTTTKRGLNRESAVYQLARAEMTALARPVLNFLNRMYPSEAAEEVAERRLANALQPATVKALVSRDEGNFRATLVYTKKKTNVSVQYSAAEADLNRVRKKLNKPSSWPAGQVGRYTFDYFLRVECAS